MNDENYLKDLLSKNTNDNEYIYFWGNTPKDKTKVDKSCFSQWYDSPFKVAGITYKTAEHYMMAQKAKLFNDTEIFEKILQSDSPKEVKSFGRQVKNYDETTWVANRMDIVIKGNVAKFSQNESLRKFILSTGNKILVEASPYDKIWGVGLKGDNPLIKDPKNWQGLNLLGFSLMEVRNHLK